MSDREVLLGRPATLQSRDDVSILQSAELVDCGLPLQRVAHGERGQQRLANAGRSSGRFATDRRHESPERLEVAAAAPEIDPVPVPKESRKGLRLVGIRIRKDERNETIAVIGDVLVEHGPELLVLPRPKAMAADEHRAGGAAAERVLQLLW